MKKMFFLLFAFWLSANVNAQELSVDTKGNLSAELIITTTGLTRAQALNALENLYIKRAVDALECINQDACFIALSNYNEYPLSGGSTTQAIITAKCFVKEGKIKVVFDDFKEKSSTRYGTTIGPLVTSRNPLDDWRRGILQRVVSEMSSNIKNSIEQAKLYWKF